MNAIHVKWFTKSNAHGMSDLMIYFETIEDHDIFTHQLAKQSVDNDPIRTFVLPLNIRDWIGDNVNRFPEKKPSKLIEHCKLAFPSHSNNFWIMAHGPIMSLRRTMINKIKYNSSFGAEPDSFYAIEQYALSLSFEKLSIRDDFSNDTVFLCASEFVPDTSQAPISVRDRIAWHPKHVMRMVFTSVNMCMQIPILCLKPNIKQFCVISADSTYKLSFLPDMKVIV